jgi:outer membrane receptor protein involved in Fe transport
VRLGVANLTDKAPPISSGGFGYNPGVSQSLLAGRSWSLELSKSF